MLFVRHIHVHVRTYYGQDFQPIQNSDNKCLCFFCIFLYFVLFLSRSTRKWRNVFLLSLILGIPTAFIAFLPVEWKVLIPGLSLRDALLCVLSTLIQVYMYVRVLYTAVCVVHAHTGIHVRVRVLYTAVCVVHAHTGIHVRTCVIHCCVCCPRSYRYTCTYVYYTVLIITVGHRTFFGSKSTNGRTKAQNARTLWPIRCSMRRCVSYM